MEPPLHEDIVGLASGLRRPGESNPAGPHDGRSDGTFFRNGEPIVRPRGFGEGDLSAPN